MTTVRVESVNEQLCTGCKFMVIEKVEREDEYGDKRPVFRCKNTELCKKLLQHAENTSLLGKLSID